MNKANGPKSSSPPISAESYQSLVQNIQAYAILMLDTTGHVISWNEGAEAIKGYSAEEIIGAHFSRFYPADAIAANIPARELEIAAQNGRLETQGLRIRKDGTAFWADVLIAPMLDSTGALTGFSNITRDLTVRHKEEVALRHSEERFRLLVSGVRDYAIFMLDPQGIVTTWNAGAEHIKGYTAKDIIGSHFSRFYPPDAIARKLPETELRGATMQGRFEDEGWRVRKDGSRFWANVIITAVRDSSGHLLGFSKITRNLTERRRHEEDLRRSEERFRLLVDGVTEYAIMMLDSDGLVTSWNAGAERIKGYSAKEILGQHVSHFYPYEAVLANQPWEDLNVARVAGRMTSEGWRVRKDGTLFWASTVVTALRDQDARLYGYAKVTQDLTQRRNAEALADTTQRMHEFIAMLAHELRNPLAPIRNAVALMGRKGLNDPVLESMRQTIDRQSVQLTRLLDELLDVNRIARGRFTIERELIDVRDVLSRALESSRPLIDDRGHSIEVMTPESPTLVQGDAVRLTQAIVNLLNNAAKYTPRGGKIRLITSVRGAEVEIKIVDNGKGIAGDMLEKVFDLFVQIDPNSNAALGGLGVGLALVRRVMELHGGSIQARSEGRSQGAEFVARLPLSIQQMRVIAETENRDENEIGRLRIMVVDDNRDAGDTMGLLLESLGQFVCTVYDGPSAIAAVQTFKPHIVLLDIWMPEMSGYEVARTIHAAESGVKPILIAITGWGQEADKARAVEAGFHHHFVKPVSQETLVKIIAQVASGLH
jgi:PAS domain S-box-containing protein